MLVPVASSHHGPWPGATVWEASSANIDRRMSEPSTADVARLLSDSERFELLELLDGAILEVWTEEDEMLALLDEAIAQWYARVFARLGPRSAGELHAPGRGIQRWAPSSSLRAEPALTDVMTAIVCPATASRNARSRAGLGYL